MADRAALRQFLRFGIVGVGNTATTLLVIWVLHERFGLSVWQASAAGYAVGTVQSYLLNRRWTFAATHSPIAPQASAFVAVNIVCGLVFSGLNATLVRFVPLPMATILTMIVVVPLSFGLNRWLVFRSRTRTEIK